MVLAAVGDLLLEQEAIGPRESVRTTDDAAPMTPLAFRMEHVVLPSPPPGTALDKIDVSDHTDARVRYRFSERLSLEVDGEITDMPAGLDSRCEDPVQNRASASLTQPNPIRSCSRRTCRPKRSARRSS